MLVAGDIVRIKESPTWNNPEFLQGEEAEVMFFSSHYTCYWVRCNGKVLIIKPSQLEKI